MRRILGAALVVAALAAGAPAASADHEGHRHAGRCGFAALDDLSGTGANTQWQGEVEILAWTVDDGVPTVEPITVACELFVNWTSRGIVASAAGTGVVAHAETLRFYAGPDDFVTMCSRVEVSGHAYVDCGYDPDPPPWPHPDLVTLLIEILNDHVFKPVVDPAVCGVLTAHAGQHGPVLIDEGGDVYLFGDSYSELWWDCPPYEYP